MLTCHVTYYPRQCNNGLLDVIPACLHPRQVWSPRSLLSQKLNIIHNFAEYKDTVVWGAPPPPPPPIIFERLKLPQQIIYYRKENLLESPNHKKYWENVLISRFYEQFSRSSRILGHFWKFEKISNSENTNISYIILKLVIWRFQIYNLFREKYNLAVLQKHLRISRNTLLLYLREI